MLRNRLHNGKRHRNRNNEFFKNIAGKYRTAETSVNFLPKLVYFQAGSMFSYVTNNIFPVNGKLNLQALALKKHINNSYIFNRYFTKSFSTGKLINSLSVKRQDARDYKSNVYMNGSTGWNSMNLYRTGHTQVKINLTNTYENVKAITNTYVSSNINADATINKSTGKHTNKAYSIIAKSYVNSSRILNYSNMFSHKTARTTVENTVTPSTGTGIVSQGRLNMEHMAKAIGRVNINEWDRRDNAVNYSAAGAENGRAAKTDNIRGRSTDLELARRETVSTAGQKHEAASQSIKTDMTKEAVTQTPLDINSIVTRVYNELERKIRIERERRGF